MARIDDAWSRQRRIKERFAPLAATAPSLAAVGCDAHQAVAREMAGWR
jgi:hypothetical protein